MTAKPITSGQMKQYKRFVEDASERALVEAGIGKEGLQKLFGNGGEFQDYLIAGIKKFSIANQYPNEEVSSSFGYLSGYRKPKGIAEQTNILRQFFPGVGFADEKFAKDPLPSKAEGYFAIPKWQTMAKTYGEAVEMVLSAISKQRKGNFRNYRNGQLGPGYLRQSAQTEKMFLALGEEQKDYDILVVPAQFGLFHRGQSVRRAREVMTSSEFGLGAFAVGIMILTHPERLQHFDDLWIDCAGDEFSPGAGGGFSCAPCFRFFGGSGVEFRASFCDCVRDRYGSASAFLPQ